MPITPGSTGVPSMRCRPGTAWTCGSSVVSRKPRCSPVRGSRRASIAEGRVGPGRQRRRVDPAGVMRTRRPSRPAPRRRRPRRACRRPVRAGPRPPRFAGGSMSMPACSMIFGIEPRVAMPMPPHAVQSMARAAVSGRAAAEAAQQLAQQVVGGAVVGLSDVAEAAGHRAERPRSRRSAGRRRRAAR